MRGGGHRRHECHGVEVLRWEGAAGQGRQQHRAALRVGHEVDAVLLGDGAHVADRLWQVILQGSRNRTPQVLEQESHSMFV